MSTPNVIIVFFITTLGTFIQVKFQSKSWTPFDSHYWLMTSFFIALFTYVVSWAANTIRQLQAPHLNGNEQAMSQISLISGALASIFLLLVILPFLGWFALFFWALYTLKHVYGLLQYASLKLLDRLIEAAHGQLNLNEERHELPV
ncbi:hypothetical protein TIFTF001_025071 [Ficus carica]|uniref:Transmembrane protein n=1 Tax=Ficus carica TaxID=3494 RepID=A0AA88ANL9_FICCA|nr:hypothetical protein TIFTF001_025071 [Ficus carica]